MSNARVIVAVSAVILLLLTTSLLSAAWFPLNTHGIEPSMSQQEARPAAKTDRLFVTLDQDGTLRDPITNLEGQALIQAMLQSSGGVTINPSATTSIGVIEQATRSIRTEGIADLQVTGFMARNGRWFATWGVSAKVGNTATQPSISLDDDRLAAIARSSGLADELPLQDKPLLYLLFMNEAGEVVGLKQIRGPQIPAVESELMHTRAISPSRRGGEAVPVVCAVEVRVP